MVMTAKERVAAFLLEHATRAYCDACLARALGIDPSTAYRAASRIGSVNGFVRQYALCSECGMSRLTIRAQG
jgi:hypothetical protein